MYTHLRYHRPRKGSLKHLTSMCSITRGAAKVPRGIVPMFRQRKWQHGLISHAFPKVDFVAL